MRVQEEHLSYGEQSTEEGKYLINTAKAIKGSKLKTKDFIKMQLMRFRKCSPVKFEGYPPQQHNSQSVQFKKYRPFDASEQQDLQKIVTNERVKMSRETKGKIKLFNNTKLNFLVEQNHSISNQSNLGLSSKTASQHYRQQKKFYGNHKTLTHQSLESRDEGRQRKGPVFRSQNLGMKMNNYLNIFIYKDRENYQADPNRGETEHISRDLVEQKHSQTIDVFKNKRNVTFMRKMKKTHKSRADSVESDLLSHFRSEQLVKPKTAATTTKRQQRIVAYNRGP